VRAFQGDEDGMSGRFLYAWPSTPAYRELTNEVSEIHPELQSALRALARLPAEDAERGLVPQAVPLSSGALAAFEEYRRHVDNLKRGLDGLERQWLVKSETHVLRLAGALTYFTWAFGLGTSSGEEPREVTEEVMAAAIALTREYFWPHARAALRQVGLTDRHRNARRVLCWITAHGKDEVSREDVRREALGRTLDAEQAQAVIDALVKWGWLREVAMKTGGRPLYRWHVNPKLFAPQGAAERAERPERPEKTPLSATSRHFPPSPETGEKRREVPDEPPSRPLRPFRQRKAGRADPVVEAPPPSDPRPVSAPRRRCTTCGGSGEITRAGGLRSPCHDCRRHEYLAWSREQVRRRNPPALGPDGDSLDDLE
jgi:hypothetical protein